MPLPDSANIQRYIQTLVVRTRRGDFIWKKVNPSTYIWDSAGAPMARLNLQRIPTTSSIDPTSPFKIRKNYFFILQALEITDSKVAEKLKIDGEIDEAVNDRLEGLFDLIQTGITEKGLDFLAQVIGTD